MSSPSLVTKTLNASFSMFAKLPFAFCLIVHQLQMRDAAKQMYQRDHSNKDFRSYRHKVLYILNSIVSRYSSVSYLNETVSDLNWCSFVIQNDYLQISNSISSQKENAST